jgi:hypothetical protein
MPSSKQRRALRIDPTKVFRLLSAEGRNQTRCTSVLSNVSLVHFTNGRLAWQTPIPDLLTELKYRQGYKYSREIGPIWIGVPSLLLF